MSDFRIVPKAEQFPAECMFSFRGPGSPDSPMLDLGRDFDDIRNQGRMYMGVEWAAEIGRAVGMVDQVELDREREQTAAAQARVEELEGELQECRAFQRAVDVIESADFRARRKSGRKPKEAVNAK